MEPILEMRSNFLYILFQNFSSASPRLILDWLPNIPQLMLWAIFLDPYGVLFFLVMLKLQTYDTCGVGLVAFLYALQYINGVVNTIEK